MVNPSLLSSQIGAAAVSAYLIQLAQKSTKLPWITEHTTQINFWVRIISSGVSALGINYAWTQDPNGMHTLSFLIPTGTTLISNLGHGLWHWFVQFAVQHGWGNLLTAGSAPAPAAK